METNDQQPDLFRPSLDVHEALKASLVEALKGSRFSRAEITIKINALLEAHEITQRITQPMLDRWCAQSAPRQMPLIILPFFCKVLGTLEPLKVLTAPLGAIVAGEREQALILLGKSQLEAKQAQRRKRLALEALRENGL